MFAKEQKSFYSTILVRKLKNKHTKIEKATRKYKTCSSANCIEANDGSIIMEKEKILERWKEYTCELFKDNRPPEYLVRMREKENLPVLKEEIV